MADYHRTRGFIIAKNDFREADQIFNIYTEDFGRLRILGRSIRKINSKLRSGIDIFYLSEIEFIQGKHYKTLTDALKIERFDNIRGDLDKLEVVYKILKAVDDLIHCEEKDDKIFNLLDKTFNRLNSCILPVNRYQLIYYYFLWNLFSIMGYQIDLYNCASCRNKLFPSSLYCNYGKGGIICSSCLDNFSKSRSIIPETIKILRLFSKDDWNIIRRLKMTEGYKTSLEEIFSDYCSNIKNCISSDQLL